MAASLVPGRALLHQGRRYSVLSVSVSACTSAKIPHRTLHLARCDSGMLIHLLCSWVLIIHFYQRPERKSMSWQDGRKRKRERKGETVPQRSEPKAHRFRNGWILFMQDVLSSQWAACRKCKKLYCINRKTALISKLENVAHVIVWEGTGNSQGLFPLSPEVVDKPEQPP